MPSTPPTASILIGVFANIPGPRVRGKVTHPLVNVLVISFLGVLCGCQGWDDLQDFGQIKEGFLRTFLDFEAGPPSADTYRRVFERLKPSTLEPIFRALTRHLVTSLEGKALAIDGKTLRGSFNKATGQKALHQVHAWLAEEGLLFGQVATDAKSNEITAIPDLLKLLDIQGMDVTIDAMGCQKSICDEIVGNSANYILGLKDNQPTLLAETEALFEQILGGASKKKKGKDYFRYEETEKGHGRTEKRVVVATSQIETLSKREQWKGLKSVVRVESHRTIGELHTVEFRYYITNLPADDIDRIARRIRGHWRVENSLHWTLDVQMGEDQSRLHSDHGPENFGILRRLALMVLKQDKTIKRGIKAKQKCAGWDNDYLLSLLVSEIPEISLPFVRRP